MTKKELFKKLDELGVKDQFITNLAINWNNDGHAAEEMYYEQVRGYDFENCIAAAFSWFKSSQGHDFWEEISKK